MLIMEEAIHVWEPEIYGKSLYLPSNFALNNNNKIAPEIVIVK